MTNEEFRESKKDSKYPFANLVVLIHQTMPNVLDRYDGYKYVGTDLVETIPYRTSPNGICFDRSHFCKTVCSEKENERDSLSDEIL